MLHHVVGILEEHCICEGVLILMFEVRIYRNTVQEFPGLGKVASLLNPVSGAMGKST